MYRLLYDLLADRSYRLVFMARALDEVIRSQRVILERQGKQSDGLEDARLAAIYRQQLQEVMRWLREQPTISVLSVDYHDVLNYPEQLNRFLGGRLDTDAMQQVPDWSLYRQRQHAATSA